MGYVTHNLSSLVYWFQFDLGACQQTKGERLKCRTNVTFQAVVGAPLLAEYDHFWRIWRSGSRKYYESSKHSDFFCDDDANTERLFETTEGSNDPGLYPGT